MPKFTDKAEFLEWFKSDEAKEIAFPIIDSKVSAGIKTYSLKHPDSHALGERLDEIEKKISEKEALLKNNELQFFAYKKCNENGIDYELLDGFPLSDEKAIDEKILQLTKTNALTKDRIVNELLANSPKPSSGQWVENSGKKTYNDYVLEAEERERH